jgi:hypothetical protein
MLRVNAKKMRKGNKIKSTHDFERSGEFLNKESHASKKILALMLAIVGTMYIIRQFITYEEFTPFYVAVFLAAPGSAVGMSLLVLKSQIHTQFARTFIFLSLALTCLFTAEQIWTVFEYFLFIDPYPSIADIFYVLSYPFFALFLFSYLKPLQKYITKQILGFAIILSSVFILPVMMTTYELNSESSIFEFAMALAYPVADAILLVPAIIGILFFFRGKRNYFWGSMLIGISLTIVGDIVFTFLDAAGAYEGGSLIDLCWLFGYVFWAFACYEYRKNSSDSIYEIENTNVFNPIDYTTIQKIVIPITITVIIMVVGISLFNVWNDVNLQEDSSHAFQHMTYIVFGIIGIFLVIMVVIYKNLERLISLRTKELREKQVIIEEQYTKLQQVEKEKGEFLAMITHELKTPLVPIKGYAELLLSEKLGKLDEGQKKRIEIINKSSDTLLKLINDLLEKLSLEN